MDVTNIVALLASLMTIPYILLYALYDYQGLLPAIAALSPQIVLYAITPCFHRLGPCAAAIYFSSMWLAFGVLCCFLFGSASGLPLFFLTGAAATMLIFGAERFLLSVLVAVLALVAFLCVEVFFKTPALAAADPALIEILFFITVPFAFLLIVTTVYFAFEEASQAEVALEKEYRFSEKLLENMLPRAVAARLRHGDTSMIADQICSATILFADIVDFTPRAAKWPPQELVTFLGRVFCCFDDLAAGHGLEKIKTIGDAYMVAGGLPEPCADHAERMALMALDMVERCRQISVEYGEPVDVRIGLESGPVVAGVISSSKLLYDVWGDTVNTAARMESHGVAGRIQVGDQFKSMLEDRFEFELRGEIEVKGKGAMRVWFLKGRKP
ncbi:adenylate cyclase [Ciceribacter naphthalenivorans]|uniref:Adenylate cyclase n=3 Tax=Pseudomonadota TaxID=1224 RepID=A0A512HET7_9HYPH|nr:adenylate cyclase [Ciceribacter naphthalenivorans]GLR21252.1 adenylate cyclase [Ciceribacter naphthalenivorans]GLT04108.1 adenylate cyclase [Sphingomonas psychrolutea]